MLLRRAGMLVVIVGCWLVAGAQAADEPVLLKYKLAKGEKQYFKSAQEMTQKQSLMGMTQENTMKQEAIMSRLVDTVASDGKATLKLKAESRKMEANFGPIGKYEFDSKSTERDTSSMVGATLTPLLERLTGSEYQVVIDTRGKVTEVTGYAELIADIVKGNPIASQFGAADNKSAAMNEQESFVVLSDKPVKPGDKWDVSQEMQLPNLGRMKSKTTYTYEGPDQVGDRKTARIGISNDMSVELDADQGGAKIKGTLSTTKSEGTVQFDIEAGRILKVQRSATMGGQLTLDVNGMTLTIDNEQTQSAQIVALEKLPE